MLQTIYSTNCTKDKYIFPISWAKRRVFGATPAKENRTVRESRIASNCHITPILRLPTELHLQIFSHLDPVFSTCLGLTCKPLYLIHRERHHKVSLFAESRMQFATRNSPHMPWIALHRLLNTWARPMALCYLDYGKFVTPRRRVEKVMEGLLLMGLPRNKEEKRWLRAWEKGLRRDKDWNAGKEVRMGSELSDMSATLSYHLRGMGL